MLQPSRIQKYSKPVLMDGPARLKAQTVDMLNLVFHTIGWQYFTKAVRRECEAAIKKTDAMATTAKPLAHFSMEAVGKTKFGHEVAALAREVCDWSWPG